MVYSLVEESNEAKKYSNIISLRYARYANTNVDAMICSVHVQLRVLSSQ